MEDNSYRILKIFINESDRFNKGPLYDWIVNEALEKNIACATVYRGLEGISGERKLHTIKLVTLSIDLPIVIEIIDKENIINDFLKNIEHAIGNGVVTIEQAKVKFYKKTGHS